MAPIVPAQNVAGRALVSVIAIMTFLSCLTLGAVTLVRDTASVWESQISREATIQIKPAEGLDMEAALEKAAEIASGFPGITGARIVDREATARLLEPWLGTGPEHRRTAGAAAGHRDHQRGLSAEFRSAARSARRRSAAGLARRPPHLGRPAGDHGAHDGDDRHRRAGADADGDRAVGGVRDARRHGRQRPHHRGAAFRRRRGALHRQRNSGGISC